MAAAKKVFGSKDLRKHILEYASKSASELSLEFKRPPFAYVNKYTKQKRDGRSTCVEQAGKWILEYLEHYPANVILHVRNGPGQSIYTKRVDLRHDYNYTSVDRDMTERRVTINFWYHRFEDWATSSNFPCDQKHLIAQKAQEWLKEFHAVTHRIGGQVPSLLIQLPFPPRIELLHSIHHAQFPRNPVWERAGKFITKQGLFFLFHTR